MVGTPNLAQFLWTLFCPYFTILLGAGRSGREVWRGAAIYLAFEHSFANFSTFFCQWLLPSTAEGMKNGRMMRWKCLKKLLSLMEMFINLFHLVTALVPLGCTLFRSPVVVMPQFVSTLLHHVHVACGVTTNSITSGCRWSVRCRYGACDGDGKFS